MTTIKSILITLVLASFTSIVFSVPNKQLPSEGHGPWVVNAYYEDLAQLRSYAQIDAIWDVNRKEKYFVVDIENIAQYQTLLSYGFDVEINKKETQSSKTIQNAILQSQPDQAFLGSGIPGFACYRTVEETFATMDNLAANNPTLASIVDIGDTWIKEDSNGSSGYDMRVLKITNSAIAGPKPILFAMSSIHARELTPAELNTRFAEYLLNNYGTDADVTWLVDHREIHLLLQGNPDGRKIAETGGNKRKNENNDYCSNQLTKGIDMNRNFFWMWNQGSGSSASSCDQTFRGPSPQSENENTAIDTYIKTLFVDARGENLNDAAASTTTGVFIDIHSYSELVLWPYGYDDPGTIPLAPNHTQLQTLGRKLSWYNNYFPQAANELYGADGASEDNAYGQLGVASYTFELGTTFSQSCGVFENTILPDNLKALIYAAKVAKTPYITASGPDIENINLSSNGIAAGTIITVTGLATDTHFSNVNGTESTQSISSVEMYIDELPWEISSTAIAMSASDGNYNSDSENFTGSIDTTGFAAGQHIVYLQSTDSNAVPGVPYAVFVNIVDPNLLGTLNGKVTDALTQQSISSVTVDFDTNQAITNAQGEFDFTIIQGTYSISAYKQGYARKTIDNISVTALQNTVQNIQLQPVCALLDDDVEMYASMSFAESAGWTHGSDAGNDDWSVDTNNGVNGSHAFKSTSVSSTSDKYLISPEILVSDTSTLEFMHKYDFEDGYDGGILEISINNGSSWADLGAHITLGNYDTTLIGNASQPLGAVLAWNGNQSTFEKVEVDLSAYDGENVIIRWRMGTDGGVGGGDWLIDDIKILDPNACIFNDIIFASGFE